jgi:hypothetical protein
MTGHKATDAAPRHRWLWVATGLTLFFLLIPGLIVLLVKAPDLYGAADGAAQATATTRGGILTVTAALIAATAAGAGLYFNASTLGLNKATLQETQQANRDADQRDRYVMAINHLGSQNFAQRVGGVFALERIMLSSEKDHGTVVHVLASFVRVQSRSTEPGARSPSGGPGEDVKAAMTVLGRRPECAESDRLRLSDSYLRATTLRCARLNCAALRRCDLERAHWERASLVGAEMDGANLKNADLEYADLRHASLEGAILTGARLMGAHLANASITHGALSQTQLDQAHCRPDARFCAEARPLVRLPCDEFEP